MENFNVPAIAFWKKKKKEITPAAFELYTAYVCLWYEQDKAEWLYLTTPALVSYTNVKRSTLFYANKQLIKAGLIKKNKYKQFRINHLKEVSNGA